MRLVPSLVCSRPWLYWESGTLLAGPHLVRVLVEDWLGLTEGLECMEGLIKKGEELAIRNVRSKRVSPPFPFENCAGALLRAMLHMRVSESWLDDKLELED